MNVHPVPSDFLFLNLPYKKNHVFIQNTCASALALRYRLVGDHLQQKLASIALLLTEPLCLYIYGPEVILVWYHCICVLLFSPLEVLCGLHPAAASIKLRNPSQRHWLHILFCTDDKSRCNNVLLVSALESSQCFGLFSNQVQTISVSQNSKRESLRR